jgi:type II secretory pathway pseudopilin PulG
VVDGFRASSERIGGEMPNRAKHVVLVIVISLTVFGIPSSPALASKQDNALAVNVLRAINTAEYKYKLNRGAYAPWDVLATSSEFIKDGLPWAVSQDPEVSKIQFSAKPDVVPGWNLRILISGNSQNYDASLERTNDSCHFAVRSDERGIITESKTLECEK